MDEFWIPTREKKPAGRPIVLMLLENKQYVVDHFATKWGSDQVAVDYWQPLLPPVSKEEYYRAIGFKYVEDDYILETYIENLGTVRACSGCGALVAGGPTRCTRCAYEGDPRQSKMSVLWLKLKRKINTMLV